MRNFNTSSWKMLGCGLSLAGTVAVGCTTHTETTPSAPSSTEAPVRKCHGVITAIKRSSDVSREYTVEDMTEDCTPLYGMVSREQIGAIVVGDTFVAECDTGQDNGRSLLTTRIRHLESDRAGNISTTPNLYEQMINDGLEACPPATGQND